jgi:arylsulfatase A-like enzyme
MSNSSRRTFLKTTALGSTSLALARNLAAQPAATTAPGTQPRRTTLAKAPRQPNVLLLWTDQHRADTMPYANNPVIKTPTFTELAARSFVFPGARCTQPVCTPSRGSIMTGLWPHQHGSIQNNIPLRSDARCIAEMLTANYATAYMGKWHLGSEITAQHGFKEWISIEDGIYRQFYANREDRKRRSSYHSFLLKNGFPPDEIEEDTKVALYSRTMAAAMAEPFTKAHFLAHEAERFLRERRDGQPFFLSVNTLEPHPPTYGPLNGTYDPATMPTGSAFAVPVGADASPLARRAYENFQKKGYKNHPISTRDDWRRLRANYYGLITMVDRAFGRILRALEESGQADNTIIVYTSDHGEMGGDHCLMQKSVFYEQATNIPLMIHVPWLAQSQTRLDGPLSLVDLVPTMLDLMGIDRPSDLPGQSRAGALRDPKTWKQEDIVVEWHGEELKTEDGRSLVGKDGWKLNVYGTDTPELYDLNTDPGELRNLARNSAQRDRVRRMTDQLKGWQARNKDHKVQLAV